MTNEKYCCVTLSRDLLQLIRYQLRFKRQGLNTSSSKVRYNLHEQWKELFKISKFNFPNIFQKASVENSVLIDQSDSILPLHVRCLDLAFENCEIDCWIRLDLDKLADLQYQLKTTVYRISTIKESALVSCDI